MCILTNHEVERLKEAMTVFARCCYSLLKLDAMGNSLQIFCQISSQRKRCWRPPTLELALNIWIFICPQTTEKNIWTLSCFAFCVQPTAKNAQYIWSPRPERSLLPNIPDLYTFTMLRQMKHLWTNYKGLYKTFDGFQFHHIVLNQMKDSVAILREGDVRGEDGIFLQSCVHLQKSVRVNDESPKC